jgi:hypothetical protein
MQSPIVGIHRTPAKAILEVHGMWLERILYVTQDLAPDDGFNSFLTTEEGWKDAIRRELGFSGTLLHSIGEMSLPDEDLSWPLPDDLWIGGGYAEAFWRALCGDVIHTSEDQTGEGNYRRASLTDYQSYRAWAEEDNKGLTRRRSTVKGPRIFNYVRSDSANRERNRFFYAMQTMTAGRCMFVTESQRIGVGPGALTQGTRSPCCRVAQCRFF